MKKKLKTTLCVAFLSVTFISCGDVSRKVDENIDKLINKTQYLDSLLNQEVDKVLTLDSLIDKEHQKVIKLDSLIQKSSSKLDSVVNKVLKPQN
ncbi:hypothetical protein SAMN03080617_03671 [Algoriphagus alkaliphilus]|uniref:Lipoprotein n=1 Tax=Algoriphagus alkaliphilus TaxID=279824 RepID=A0A1G5ZER1_9BACT|nr:hypothetical protein [Algoriphagus alkaliphilus]MBA4300385.1 hypothetical protein [Cyclobacterium sp.]SDA93036.1 hypothetical protein SAMN03080617_03671 [Algoriphagus alkaliphilus]